jgi:hypothetical protein
LVAGGGVIENNGEPGGWNHKQEESDYEELVAVWR